MIRNFVKENSSTIFKVSAGLGVITTAYLGARAGYHHAKSMESQDPYMSNKEVAKRVWKLYAPAGVAGAATVVCIAGAGRIDGRKTLAAQAALAVSQRAYEGYRAEVVDALGEKKDQAFLAKAAEHRIQETTVPAIVIGNGDILCCELFTGRYFKSSMQSLVTAVNEINSKMLKHDYASMDDFYYLIGLEYTSTSGQAGWKCDRLVELEFSSLIHQGEPVLAFDYNYVKTF